MCYTYIRGATILLTEFIPGLRFRAAARQYARRLAPQVGKDYGASAFYSAQQVNKSAARAGLPADYVVFNMLYLWTSPRL